MVAEAEIVEVRNPQWGKWGGRVVANVLIDGESLAVALVQSLHGRWYGGGAREDWCHRAATGATAGAGDDLADFVDGLLARADRRESAAEPAGPGELQAEMERHVLDPCLAVSIESGAVGAGVVDGTDRAGAVATLKRIARPEVARLESLARPLVGGRPQPIRQKLYDFLRAVCIADFAGGAS